jgi:hypothetical protein
MNLELFRDAEGRFNFGKLFVDGKYLGETLEDPEREVKIDGDTAIPRGRYRVTLTMSNRFKRIMPYVHDVPGFEGVRIHGGNTEADTHGCPLLGAVRTLTGIAQCAGVNQRLIDLIDAATKRNEEVWLEIS